MNTARLQSLVFLEESEIMSEDRNTKRENSHSSIYMYNVGICG